MPLLLRVTDIIITERDVEVPDACPACGADLRRADGLTLWEYQEERRTTTAGADESDERFDVPEGGVATLQLRWSCAACARVLAEGREANHDEDVTAPLFERREPRPVEDGRHDPEL